MCSEIKAFFIKRFIYFLLNVESIFPIRTEHMLPER